VHSRSASNGNTLTRDIALDVCGTDDVVELPAYLAADAISNASGPAPERLFVTVLQSDSASFEECP
jgi:hypothetical protein